MSAPAFSVAQAPAALRNGASFLPHTTLPQGPAPGAHRLRPRRAPRATRRAAPPRLCARPPDQPPSGNSGGSGGGPTDKDDEALQLELSAKVNELFGGRQNVTIDMDGDGDRAKFVVRRARGGLVGRGGTVAEANTDAERGAALTVVTSVVVLSVVAGVIFTLLYYSGAVHGSSSADSRRYDMPTYGTSSYVDPYELLDDERKAAEAADAQ